MLKESYPYYLASEPHYANTDLDVTNKYTGEVATKVAMADADTIDKAIAAAEEAQPAMAALAPFERQAVLEHCVKRFTERADELAQALCIEAGKPIKDAKGEVSRLIDTFKIAAEESVRINGEVVNLEISARAKGYQGMTKKVPIGPCSFISPFNFPLNLAAHKVAPAIAAGCTFVLKPASRTPIGALIIGEVLAETALPKGAFSILPCSRDGADLFTTDERLKLLSFTGSPDVGWALKAKAGKKPVVLELGGNAACVVDEDADIEDAIERVIVGAYYQSGQSCISVQRLLVHSKKYDELNLIVVYVGTKGISIGAHKKGRVVDVNQSLDGNGPFGVTRAGTLPTGELIKLCFSGKYTEDEMYNLITRGGGYQAYLGTDNMDEIDQRLLSGDEKAIFVSYACSYQVAKEVGSMYTVLEGDVDAIVLSGYIFNSERFLDNVTKRIEKIAPIALYPSKNDFEAIALNGLRVIKEEIEIQEYK